MPASAAVHAQIAEQFRQERTRLQAQLVAAVNSRRDADTGTLRNQIATLSAREATAHTLADRNADALKSQQQTGVGVPSDLPPSECDIKGGSSGDCGGSSGDSTAAGDGPSPATPNLDPACKCIEAAMNAIARTQQQIADALSRKLNGACDSIDDCRDKILDAIKKKLEGPQASCDECKRMVKAGLGGTLEFAVKCAGACIEETENVCSLGDESSWGKPCKTCGKECCICDKGVCKETECPPEEGEKPKAKFIGWCSPATGTVTVTKSDQGAPGFGWIQVALSDTEESAAYLASQNCKAELRTGYFTPNISPIQVTSPLCDLNKFILGSALKDLTSKAAVVNLSDAARQSNEGLLSINFAGLNLENPGEALYGMVRAAFGLPQYFQDQLAPSVMGALGCYSDDWKTGLTMLSQIQSIGKWIGMDFMPYTTQLQYGLNSACRQRFLEPNQSIAAYLADAVSTKQLDTYWAVHGLCNESLNHYVQAARAKRNVQQLALLRRRKIIDEKEYAKGVRQLGYLDPQEPSQLFTLTESLPTLQDILRFMVRDADDETIEFWPQSDEIFKQKYGKQLKEWSEWQGVPENVAKYAWRSHWTIPSPSQLFEFWHRLRYDDRFGGKDALEKRIKGALTQQDILPFWHDYYLAVSFRPMSRVDVRRAFNLGSLKEDDVKKSYLALGYSDDDADRLTKFAVKLRDQSASGHKAVKLWVKLAITRDEAVTRMRDDGLPQDAIDKALSDSEVLFASTEPALSFIRGDISRDDLINTLASYGVSQVGADRIAVKLSYRKTGHIAIKDYIYGLMEREAAGQEMIADGFSSVAASRLLDEADRVVRQSSVVSCQKGIKRRYLTGELDAQEATNELVTTGTTNQRASTLVGQWDCERKSSGKHVAANKLCQWLARGVITSNDFVKRLERVGYSAADAAIMLDDCLISVNVKRLAEAKKLLKEQQQVERKAALALQRLNAQQQRLFAQSQRASQAAKAAIANRRKQLLSAASKVEKKCDCDIYSSVSLVEQNKTRIQTDYGLSVDEALQVLLLASEAWQGGPLDSYSDVVTNFAEAAVSEVPSTNGELQATS